MPRRSNGASSKAYGTTIYTALQVLIRYDYQATSAQNLSLVGAAYLCLTMVAISLTTLVWLTFPLAIINQVLIRHFYDDDDG